MHPSSIISYYPSYSILDGILSQSNYNEMNIYLDVKNIAQTIFMEHAIVNIVESSLKTKRVDTSIFASMISFLAFHKLYSIKRQNLKIKYFLFFETGKSFYHLNVDKKYKVNRRIDDLYGLEREKREYFFEIVQRNLKFMESALNRIPDIKVIRMENLEADFIPYYLITRNLVDRRPNVAHVIYSNDHDLYQDVMDDVYLFSKSAQTKKVIKKGEVFKNYLKENIPDEYLSLVMSVVGDPGDSVDGIKGIGGKTVAKIIDQLVTMVDGMESLYENVLNDKPIFDLSKYTEPNKYIDLIIQEEKENKRISRNMKLVSFEVLSRFLDSPIKTEMIDKRKYIHEILNNNSLTTLEPMKEVMNKLNIFLQEDSLETLYFKKEEPIC